MCVWRFITYAQKSAAEGLPFIHLEDGRYQSHSARKLLILLGFQICFFSVQPKKTLDLQGSPARKCNLSTKLSTEKLDCPQSSLKSST
jgi:hypothetical protein